jgi:hypothetical protein
MQALGAPNGGIQGMRTSREEETKEEETEEEIAGMDADERR